AARVAARLDQPLGGPGFAQSDGGPRPRARFRRAGDRVDHRRGDGMKRPWTVALIAAAGATLLIASAFALLAPPEMLDAAIELGDRRLWLALLAVFVMAAGAARLALIRRRSPEDQVAEAAALQGGSHLRRAGHPP